MGVVVFMCSRSRDDLGPRRHIIRKRRRRLAYEVAVLVFVQILMNGKKKRHSFTISASSTTRPNTVINDVLGLLLLDGCGHVSILLFVVRWKGGWETQTPICNSAPLSNQCSRVSRPRLMRLLPWNASDRPHTSDDDSESRCAHWIWITLGETNEKLSLRLRDGLLREHLRAIRFPGSSF